METAEEFIAAIETHKAAIYKVCYLYAPPGQLEDYYQEVLTRLWSSWPQFRGESSRLTWIYRISLYTCLSFVRRRYARPQTVPLSLDLKVFEQDAEARRQRDELYAVINRLGRLEKALILLWLEEKSYDEIAQITGLTRTNIAVKLMRIREKIKHMSNQ